MPDLLYKKTVKIDAIPSPLEIADTSSSVSLKSSRLVHAFFSLLLFVLFTSRTTHPTDKTAAKNKSVKTRQGILDTEKWQTAETSGWQMMCHRLLEFLRHIHSY
jgi:hypothetical protein